MPRLKDALTAFVRLEAQGPIRPSRPTESIDRTVFFGPGDPKIALRLSVEFKRQNEENDLNKGFGKWREGWNHEPAAGWTRF